MPKHQLDVFWRHFRKLDSERLHFDKPPATWKPPEFRDMSQDELTAYWDGFREIVAGQTDQIVEPPRISEGKDGDDAEIVKVSDDEPPRKRIRITGKTSPTELVQKVSANSNGQIVELSADNAVSTTDRKRKKNDDLVARPKRKYEMKVKVSRDGKNSSVSIWNKVQLFKETRFCSLLYGTSVLKVGDLLSVFSQNN